MSRLDEIEARLAAATPGPWEAVTDEHKHAKEYSVWADSRSDYVAEWVATQADADLLAQIPDDLAALVKFARDAQRLETTYNADAGYSLGYEGYRDAVHALLVELDGGAS